MKASHREHGTVFAGERGTAKGLAFSGFRHPIQHVRDGSPEGRIENGAWFAVALPTAFFLTLGALAWDVLCWSLAGPLFGLLFFLPVAWFGWSFIAGCGRLIASWRSR